MVPWGALAARTAAQLSSVPVFEYADYNVDTTYGDRPSVTKASVRKSCRTGSVTGFSCGPDRALPASLSIGGCQTTRVEEVSHTNWHREGCQYAPPFDPPRDF